MRGAAGRGMKILGRYIRRNVTAYTLTVLIVLVAIFSFFQFLDELDNLGKGTYGLLQVIEFVLLSTPQRAYQLFPIAALIGSLIGLGTLMRSSEIVAIRAAGVSLRSVVMAVIRAGFVLSILALILGEFVAPPSEEMARYRRSVEMADQIALKSPYGFWMRDGHSYINIRKVLPGNRLKDIYIYEFDRDHHLRVSTHAQSAHYENGQWVLENIQQTELSEKAITKRHIAKAAWESLLKPDLINTVVIDPDSLSMRALISYIAYMRNNGQDSLRYEQALWTKMVFPFATLVMVFLAIPMVLRSSRTATMGQRVMLGSLVGLGFHIVNQASAHLSVVYHLNAAMSATVPTGVTLLAAIYLMRRVR